MATQAEIRGKRSRSTIIQVLACLLAFAFISQCFAFSPKVSFASSSSAFTSSFYPQVSYLTGITWVNEPLDQVFYEIQLKFIGLAQGNYIPPNDSDYSMIGNIFGLVNSGIANSNASSIERASLLANEINYQLLPVNDPGTGKKYFVLRENPGINRGWGSYFFVADRGTNSSQFCSTRVIVEAPHPVTDFNSQNIAYYLFVNTYPCVLGFFVSGVERTLDPYGQTDMAHISRSIFETANEAFGNSGSVVMQIHSFDVNKHPGYPDVVLSTGDGGVNGALESISSNLKSKNVTVGVFDGFEYSALGAQANVQGRYVRSVGGGFVHIEISSGVVYDPIKISDLENALAQSIFGGFKFPSYNPDVRIPAICLGVVGIFLVTQKGILKYKKKQ